MKKLLIPIEIKSEKDLPEKNGYYFISNENDIEKDHIHYVKYFERNNNAIKNIWLDYVKIWYKEVSKEKYNNKLLHEFIDWHNEKYPEKYIPNSEIGKFNLQINNK